MRERFVDGDCRTGGRQPSRCRRLGFTLLELLVSIAIVGLLLAILAPAIGATMKSARSFRCQTSLRSIAFDFSVFADDDMHGDRGNDPTEVGPGSFRLETFIESQYGVDEFWAWGTAPSHALPDAAKNDPMRCPEVRGPVTVLNGLTCGMGAITPPRHISYGFNMRLHFAQVVDAGGQPIGVDAKLSSKILDEELVPLAWDVDGERAGALGSNPLFSAPMLESTAVYSNDRYWYPAPRHQGRVNVVFTDGSVRSTPRPLDENGWRWSYQPVR
ncbi:MAG: type II secretion system protein [Phycisphaerales bacterium]